MMVCRPAPAGMVEVTVARLPHTKPVSSLQTAVPAVRPGLRCSSTLSTVVVVVVPHDDA
jgi:hypothetical protein